MSSVDDELVAAFARAEKWAVARIYAEELPGLLRVVRAYRRLASCDALDVVHDAFVAVMAIAKRRTIRALDRSALHSLLMKAVVNKCRDGLRRRSTVLKFIVPGAEQVEASLERGPSATLDHESVKIEVEIAEEQAAMRKKILVRLLERLEELKKPELLDVYQKHWIEDKTQEVAAAELGLSRDQVKRRSHKIEEVASQVLEDAAEREGIRLILEDYFCREPSLRAVYYLRFREDLSPREIAETLGIREEVVKVRLQRIMKDIRSKLVPDPKGSRNEREVVADEFSAPGSRGDKRPPEPETTQEVIVEDAE